MREQIRYVPDDRDASQNYAKKSEALAVDYYEALRILGRIVRQLGEGGVATVKDEQIDAAFEQLRTLRSKVRQVSAALKEESNG